MTSPGPPEDARRKPHPDAPEDESQALEGEIIDVAHDRTDPPGPPAGPPPALPGPGSGLPGPAVPGSGLSGPGFPVVPVVLVNPQHLTGAAPGNPPHLGPLTEPSDEGGGAGTPVDPYHGQDQPTPPRAPATMIGAFPFHTKAPQIPTDPITPYLSAPVKRGRRSEWPVMAFVMVVVAIVMISCCIAGYGLFFRHHPFP